MTDITQLQTGCPAYTESVGTSYGYVPSLGAGIAYCVLFGLSMILHTIQFAWKRQWWASVFSIGCLVELIGWAGRTWSAKCPYNSTAFLMQIATLVIAPTFFTAGIYILLGRFIQLLGPESSIIKPKLYLWIFCTCDIVSLVIQAVGGGMASGEAGVVGGDTATGTHIMVAGIVFQLVSITIFIFCAVDFVRRVIRKSLLQSVTGSVIPPVRCDDTFHRLYGWDGYLITHESYFIGLDGAMMIVSVGVFNVLHPGWMLPSGRSESYKMEMGSIDGSDN
ncbi:RTA-like protein [Penicillium cf. griseofulvum]|nr:RTA-like protein [Penicillium cf. griseofulvum]